MLIRGSCRIWLGSRAVTMNWSLSLHDKAFSLASRWMAIWLLFQWLVFLAAYYSYLESMGKTTDAWPHPQFSWLVLRVPQVVLMFSLIWVLFSFRNNGVSLAERVFPCYFTLCGNHFSNYTLTYCFYQAPRIVYCCLILRQEYEVLSSLSVAGFFLPTWVLHLWCAYVLS